MFRNSHKVEISLRISVWCYGLTILILYFSPLLPVCPFSRTDLDVFVKSLAGFGLLCQISRMLVEYLVLGRFRFSNSLEELKRWFYREIHSHNL